MTMRMSGGGADPHMLSEMLAMVILRGSSDTLSFTAEQQDELRRAFPGGFALVAYGEPATRSLSLKLMGREAMAMIERIHEEMEAGSLGTLERLFGAEGGAQGGDTAPEAGPDTEADVVLVRGVIDDLARLIESEEGATDRAREALARMLEQRADEPVGDEEPGDGAGG